MPHAVSIVGAILQRVLCETGPIGRNGSILPYAIVMEFGELVFLKLQNIVRCIVADLDAGQRDGSRETTIASFSYDHEKFVAVEYLTKRGAAFASN